MKFGIKDTSHSREGFLESVKKWFGRKMDVPVSFTLTLSSHSNIVDDGNYVIINAFPLGWFIKKVREIYNINKLQKMFESSRSGGIIWWRKNVRIHKFFLPEFVYILGQCKDGGNTAQRWIDDIVSSTWLRDMASTDNIVSGTDLSRVAADMNVKLFDWQRAFIEQYDIKRQQAHLHGELLSFGCGLGKTITSLALMKSLGCDCVIVIAPKSTLEDVWVDHIRRFYKKPQKYYLVNKTDPYNADIFIFNYESMDKIDKVMRYIKTKKKIGIITDESHNFLKMASNRTQNLIKLRQDTGCEHCLLMSGTPVKSCGVEVLPLLRVLDGFFDDDAERIFRKVFGLNTSFGTDILHARMNLMMHRRKMEDVFTLPEKTEVTLKIKIKDGSRYETENVKRELEKYAQDRAKFHKARMGIYEQEWDRCWSYFVSNKVINKSPEWNRYVRIIDTLRSKGYSAFDSKTGDDIAWANKYEKTTLIPSLPESLKAEFLDCRSAIKYLELKIQGEVLGRLDRIRSDMVVSMLDGIDFASLIDESIKKTIFFTSYVDVVERLDGILRNKGYTSSLVYGKTSYDTTSILNKFRSDDNIQCLIATMQTLATGVTLTEANTIVFLNDPWRDAIKTQASDRVWRIGQDTECFIYTVHLDTGSKQNLSDRTANILNWSKHMTEAITDGMF